MPAWASVGSGNLLSTFYTIKDRRQTYLIDCDTGMGRGVPGETDPGGLSLLEETSLMTLHF